MVSANSIALPFNPIIAGGGMTEDEAAARVLFPPLTL